MSCSPVIAQEKTDVKIGLNENRGIDLPDIL